MKFAVQFLLVAVCILLYAIFLYYFPPPVVDAYFSQDAINDPQNYTDLNAFSCRVKKCDRDALLHCSKFAVIILHASWKL